MTQIRSHQSHRNRPEVAGPKRSLAKVAIGKAMDESPEILDVW